MTDGPTVPYRPRGRRLDRRWLIRAGCLGAGAVLGTRLIPRAARAQSASVVAVMPGPFLPDAVRPMLQEMADARIENAPYVSPTDTLAKLMAPGGTSRYDLMISLTQFVRSPVLGEAEGDERVLPLDLSKIPNAGSIMPLFQGDVVTRGGSTFMLPIVWGYDSVIYDANHIPTDDPLTQSWGLLFDDRYAGRVAWRDDAHGMIMAAGLHLGHEDPVNMDDQALEEVTGFLTDRKKNARTLWSQFGEAVNLMSSGEVWALYGWLPMRAALKRQGMNVTNNWPKEGLLTWNQSGFIPEDAVNADAAHRVIDAMLSSAYGKALIEASAYPTTSQEVISQFSEERRRELGLDVAARGVEIYPMRWPARMSQWLQAWNTVKSA